MPFYQSLASITASGKTVILAEALTLLAPYLPVKPIVLWLSVGRVVVAQSYANLQDGGKYRHLLTDFRIRLLSEYRYDEVEDESSSLMYFATVGTFNQKDKEGSNLLLFKSDIDTADSSTWDALKARVGSSRARRPLLVVYDEAHKLTDQQTALLMELEPDAFLMASATPNKLPKAIHQVCERLMEDLTWTENDLVTYVSAKDVADSGLVKGKILMGGYQAQMEPIIDDMLDDYSVASAAASSLGLPFRPKAIYVCKTNIVEGNAFQRDDPKRPFSHRQAPPILIWRYLVEHKGVDPATVAVYARLDVDKDHKLPGEFVLFRGGDSDYDRFVGGNFRHIIFNLGLQEGWDDPECYFAYIDRSMQSNAQVEQVIGRVLRQPDAKHYEHDALNTARFYVRVDKQGVFAEIVEDVRKKLSGKTPEVEFSWYSSTRTKPVPMSPREVRTVPHVYRDSSGARKSIDAIIDALVDFRNDTSDNVRGRGAKALVQQRVGADDESELIWIERENHNRVTARWIFQQAVRRDFALALDVTPSDDPKFDALIELGSKAENLVVETARQVVDAYLEHVVLKQRLHNPYVVSEVFANPTKLQKFDNALHEAYSALNPSLEEPFARALDKTGLTWSRNPSMSGYPIPLLSRGKTKSFYPDFIVWSGSLVLAIDTTGEHLLSDKLGRKLLDVRADPKSDTTLKVRLVSEGRWDSTPQHVSDDGYTVFALGAGNALKTINAKDLDEAVEICLRPEL